MAWESSSTPPAQATLRVNLNRPLPDPHLLPLLPGEGLQAGLFLGRGVGRAGLVPLASGTVAFDGRDISQLSEAEMRPLRRRMQMVFQGPLRVPSSAEPELTRSTIKNANADFRVSRRKSPHKIAEIFPAKAANVDHMADGYTFA